MVGGEADDLSRDFYSIVHSVSDQLSEYWQDTTLIKVTVNNRQKLWTLWVEIPAPIPSDWVEQTSAELIQKWSFVEDINIHLLLKDSTLPLQRLLDTRRDEISSCFFADCNMADIDWRIEDCRIDIIVKQDQEYQNIIDNEICSQFSQWFWDQYKLRVLVRAVWAGIESQTPVCEQPALDNEINVLEIADFTSDNNTWKKRSSKRSSDEKGNIQKESIMNIQDLQEGMLSAAVEGEIWYKECSALRDGRFLMTYYLTDYHDTILIKKFSSSEEDDEINVGDWIKVSGSVRYDNYAKELVLYMNAYLQQEKAVRQDQSREKRIELHAHTKMSAMDGLTEVGALIKRAAYWGHKAIAITDHGGIQAFPDASKAAKKYKIKVIYGLEGYLIENDKKEKSYHIILLAQNRAGLRNMYELISKSYLDYFYRHPKITRKLLQEHREGLLIGTACEAGELYQAILNGQPEVEIRKIAEFYDYLEIQPIANNQFLVREGRVKDDDELKQMNKYIVQLAKQLNKPFVASGDVHFLDPVDQIYRNIIQSGQGYEDVQTDSPLYFKSTDEMLEEFSHLGLDDARAAVIDFPAWLNEQIEQTQPVPDGFYPPKIDTAEEEIIELSMNKVHRLYGHNLPPVVEKRINHELDSITRHGFSVLYLIAHKLVVKSNQDGYLVGSRGSVGSSFVAYLTDITEVNPLQPHWRCTKCQYSDFDAGEEVECGVDLEDKNCPNCGSLMKKDGFNIPFETFLGFEGDKVPDIDLNFSGDYQMHAHHYVEELFGSENVFRAGTISTIAEKTAYGFVKKYVEQFQLNVKNSEIKRLAMGITGVRRTTGQHPGGMIVVPKGSNIHDFTPLQHPADNKESGVVTTHFEYHAIGDQLVKLDILGHDDPTVIRELEDLTGIKASDISLSDEKTMRIFSSLDSLNLQEKIGSNIGTFGIPEFGTRFVRQMLEATRPTTFGELVRISGLSHGTDVWLNNAQDLIEESIADLTQVICTRDDIMTYLIDKGVEKKKGFTIMEKVRKGKGLGDEDIAIMQGRDVPEWYIDSCQKIKYMFPRAHAVAYVTMAFRIAYFKVNYPLEFYASFFGIRAEDFDAQTVLQGYTAVQNKIKEIDKMGHAASQKDKKLVTILELALELYARGFQFYPVDIYHSDARKFIVYQNGLLLPFSALPNVGVNVAQGISTARQQGPFVSVEDFQVRTRLNKTAMNILREYNCFDGLPETTQISLFG